MTKINLRRTVYFNTHRHIKKTDVQCLGLHTALRIAQRVEVYSLKTL